MGKNSKFITMYHDFSESNRKNLFKRIEDSTEYEGAIPEMDKYVKLWGGIWERDEHKPNLAWKEKTRKEMNEKITSVKEFGITENGLNSEIKTKKLGSTRK